MFVAILLDNRYWVVENTLTGVILHTRDKVRMFPTVEKAEAYIKSLSDDLNIILARLTEKFGD